MPNRICKYCKNTATIGQSSFCSKKCQRNFRVIKRKLASIKILGSKCSICGYSKNISALVFHHKDPSSKDFGLSARERDVKWSKYVEEIKKCILVCHNCHSELHNPHLNKDILF